MKNIRVGIAGLGFGANVHVPGFRLVQNVEIAAITGTNQERVQEIASRLNIPIACTGIDQLLEQNIDVVSLALPPKQNEEAIKKALEKKVHVLSEKPLASCAETALLLAEKAKHYTTCVDFQFAELSAFQTLKYIVDNQQFGKVKQVYINWSVESYAQKHKRWSWKTDERQSGGVLSLMAPHSVYLLDWLFGSINKVYAITSNDATKLFTPRGETPAPDLVSLTCLHKSEISVSAFIRNSCQKEIGHLWILFCEKATLELYNPGPNYMQGFSLKMFNGNKEEVLLNSQEQFSQNDERVLPFSKLANRFIKAVQENTHTYPDFDKGAKVQLVLDAIRESSKTKKQINIY